jgi:5'(3')-deoxyribonucleotidase
MITRIFCDVDGVLADWVGDVARLFGRDPDELYESWPVGEGNIAKVLEVSNNELWRNIHSMGRVFWRSLCTYSWCKELLDDLESIAPVTILTAPSRESSSCSGKYEWVCRNLPAYERRTLIGADKASCAHAGAMLLDDRDANCEAFREAGGNACIFPRVWNSAHEYADDPMSYVRAYLGTLKGIRNA